jgi:hypothetical protein
MAPSIPTHRPLVTATRVSVSIAVAACASSLYLAFGSASAATNPPMRDTTASASCPLASIDAESDRATPGARTAEPAVR